MRSVGQSVWIAFTGLAILGLYVISIQAMESEKTIVPDENVLPICEKKNVLRNQQGPDILLVSTLDGTITAIDPNENGKTLWSVATGPGSMLSSTISQVELTNNAKWVRLIPSLAGGLYKFDGEVIEAIPLSAEELLRTSFKFADNTVMTGGKETRVYGIEAKTGRIKYECTMEGCFGPTGETLSPEENDMEDVIIVKRENQVVRAVEPRTGSEKWNFSVSSHHLSFQPGLEDICNTTEDEEILPEDLEDLKAVVPDGIICQVDKEKPDVVKWKHNFKSPIVHAWKLERGQLIPINLFSNTHLPKSSHDDKSDPTLYIGSYNQQLYIQESDHQRSQAQSKENLYPKVSWKPYLISADSRTTIINHGVQPAQNELPMLTYDPSTAENTALAVFNQGGNAEYPYDSGLYFYTEEANLEYDLVEDMKNNATKEPSKALTHVPGEEDEPLEEIQRTEESDTPTQAMQIVFVSMWYWWQEIVLISLLTAAVMNILITRPYIMGMREGFRRRIEQITRRRPQVLIVERHIEVPYEVQVEVPVPKTPETGSSAGTTVNFSRSVSGTSGSSGADFVSRYLTDYEPVQCLGAGGFGIVLESKNKLDENHYAVKRVRLPSHEEAKKKVMREVKCLAKLDQKNIVRYYSTWLEYPPPGWQEQMDKMLKLQQKDQTDESVSHLTVGTSESNPLKPFDSQPRSATDLKSYARSQEDEDSFRVVFTTASDDDDDEDENENSCLTEEDDDEDESSCGIVFQDDSKSKMLQKPAPSRSISIVSMTNSKFWKEISSDENETEEECMDAMVWDHKNQKPPSVYLYIVMQLCQKESLRSWLRHNEKSRNRLHCLDMFNQICAGVEYVHSQGVIHRDLKPSNIFFANDGTIKIGDFGLATAGGNSTEDSSGGGGGAGGGGDLQQNYSEDNLLNIEDGHTEEVGTELYMSPEQLSKKPYNAKVDIYSLGLILFELLVPFSTQMERIHTLTKLRQLDFPKDFTARPEYELVKSMLDHDPSERPEAIDIMEMEFLRQAQLDYENEVSLNHCEAVSSGSGDYMSMAATQRRRRKHLSSGGSNQSSQ